MRECVPNKQWLRLEDEGLVAVQRIVAIGLAESAPMRRLIQVVTPARVVTLTGGKRRQTVLVLDSGHLILTAYSLSWLWQNLEET